MRHSWQPARCTSLPVSQIPNNISFQTKAAPCHLSHSFEIANSIVWNVDVERLHSSMHKYFSVRQKGQEQVKAYRLSVACYMLHARKRSTFSQNCISTVIIPVTYIEEKLTPTPYIFLSFFSSEQSIFASRMEWGMLCMYR
jgi:hypothetical protein